MMIGVKIVLGLGEGDRHDVVSQSASRRSPIRAL